MNKEIILFYYPNRKFFISKVVENKLNEKYSKIILFKNFYKINFLNFKYNKKKLNMIRDNYKKKGINLDMKRIYEINYFLQKIRLKSKKNKIFVSPYFISGVVLEDEFIFYEISKIYKMQFIRPEISFIKNRYILAKNLLKQPFPLKKKTNFSIKNYKKFKINYINSIETFSAGKIKNKLNAYFFKVLVNMLSFFFGFKFNTKPNKYALVILNNDEKLNLLADTTKLKYFINNYLSNSNSELVFLIHPRTNPLMFFLRKFKNEKYLFNNNKIQFIHQPKNLVSIIQDSQFTIHLSSSLSAQTILFNKKVLCVGKNIIYIHKVNNIVSDLGKKYYNFLKKKINENDIIKIDKFLINYLSNSIDINTKLKLYTKTKDYMPSNLKSVRRNDLKIIHSLLNAI